MTPASAASDEPVSDLDACAVDTLRIEACLARGPRIRERLRRVAVASRENALCQWRIWNEAYALFQAKRNEFVLHAPVEEVVRGLFGNNACIALRLGQRHAS